MRLMHIKSYGEYSIVQRFCQLSKTLPRLCGEISMLDRRRSGGNPVCHLRRTILDII